MELAQKDLKYTAWQQLRYEKLLNDVEKSKSKAKHSKDFEMDK